MIVRKISIWSGRLHSIDLPITQEDYDAWRTGKEMVQDIFPHLLPWQREYLINGMTDDEWKDAFGEADEDTQQTFQGERHA